jgi:hypothetical protein
MRRATRPATPEHIRCIIKLWLEKASLFYTRQTAPLDFRVVLLYDDRYADVVSEFTYPVWSCLSTDSVTQWLNAHASGPVTLTRIDADDSFSVDFFDYLRSLSFQERTLILYKRLRHYDISRRILSEELWHPSPHFATLYFPDLPKLDEHENAGRGILRGIHGDHSTYHRHAHVVPEKCYALARITGRNIYNRYGLIMASHKHPKPACLDDRFVGY